MSTPAIISQLITHPINVNEVQTDSLLHMPLQTMRRWVSSRNGAFMVCAATSIATACCMAPHLHQVAAIATNAASPPQLENDRFNLQRFVDMHRQDFPMALREIQSGRKRGHWSWYVFPVGPFVVNGRERGSMINQYYALRDPPPDDLQAEAAAGAYLKTPRVGDVDLRKNYLDIMQAVQRQVAVEGVHPVTLLGSLDVPKVVSSLELFERVSANGVDTEVHEVCKETLKAIQDALEAGGGASRSWW